MMKKRSRVFFFFSSRRRHTRCLSDWSSDVCSSDLREIGYWIHKDHINQGLATEATAALTKVAFGIEHVTRIEIHCDPNNLRSAAVPRKLGFCHEATLRQRTRTPDGRPRDTMIWTLLADEYPTSPAAAAEIEAFDAVGRKLL